MKENVISIDLRRSQKPKPTSAGVEALRLSIRMQQVEEPSESLEAIGDMYKEYSVYDAVCIVALDRFREAGLISSAEQMHLFVLIQAGDAQGIAVTADIRDRLVNPQFGHSRELEERISASEFSPHVKEYILGILRRLP